MLWRRGGEWVFGTRNMDVLQFQRKRVVGTFKERFMRVKILFTALLALGISMAVPARGAAESVAIIGGADGPTTIVVAGGSNPMAILEAQLPWLTFSDASAEATQRAADALGEIGGSYVFLGRVAEDGSFGYIVGFLTAEGSPLAGLVSSRSSAPGRGDVTELTAEGAEEPAFVLSEIELYYDRDAPDVVVAVPAKFRKRGYGGLCAMIARGDFASLEDAAARGVSVCVPPAPYLCVSLRGGGAWRSEYIPLTEDDVMAAYASSYVVTPEQMGDGAIVLTTEDGTNPDGGISGSLYKLAAEKCGFTIASPGGIGTVIRAVMTVTGSDGAAHTQEIGDQATLAELAELLRGAQWTDVGGCPFDGILVLTMEDGSVMTIYKATDSCGTMIFGSAACYEISFAENERFWRIFSDSWEALNWTD